MVTIGWAVGLIFQAMNSALGWFVDILRSIEGSTGFYLACFTVFTTSGILLMRLRSSPPVDGEEQKGDNN